MSDDPRFYPPVVNVRGIERLRLEVLPSFQEFREPAKQALFDALQTAFGLETRAHHGHLWVNAYVYVREETREAEAVVAGLQLSQKGRLQADICGAESGTIHYEVDAVYLGHSP